MDLLQILEYEAPSSLLADPTSRFSHMMSVCMDTPGAMSFESLDTAITEAWV